MDKEIPKIYILLCDEENTKTRVLLCCTRKYAHYVDIAVFFFFRCRTAGYKSVFGRSCDRPYRHRFFLVSLCLKANAEMVPKIPSFHSMLLV